MHIITTVAIIIGALILCWILLSIRPYIKLIKIRSANKSTSINALPDKGWVEIVGIIGQRVIQSPIEKTECAYWRLDVEELIQTISGSMVKGYSSEWKLRTLLKQASAEPIEIDDATGKILVHPKHIDLLIDHPSHYIELDEQKLNTLNQIGIKTVNSNGMNRELAVYEQTIAPGIEVHVLGEIRKDGFQRSMIKPIIFSGDKVVIINKLKKQIQANILIVLFIAVIGLIIWLLPRGNTGHLRR